MKKFLDKVLHISVRFELVNILAYDGIFNKKCPLNALKRLHTKTLYNVITKL